MNNINEKKDSFGGELAKWLVPVLLSVVGFVSIAFYNNMNKTLTEIQNFMLNEKLMHEGQRYRLEKLEESDEEQDQKIHILMTDKFFVIPEELKKPKRGK